MSATFDKLLDVAENAMRLRGYHAVSFRDLADELGIKSASVHYHFRQKEDLGLALVSRYSDRFFSSLEKRAANSKTSTDRLAAFCKTYQLALKNTDKICLGGLLGAETCGLPDTLRRAVAKFFASNIDWVAHALPENMPARQKQARAAQVVATLQGAMMLAIALNNLKIFDDAANELLADIDGQKVVS